MGLGEEEDGPGFFFLCGLSGWAARVGVKSIETGISGGELRDPAPVAATAAGDANVIAVAGAGDEGYDILESWEREKWGKRKKSEGEEMDQGEKKMRTKMEI